MTAERGEYLAVRGLLVGPLPGTSSFAPEKAANAKRRNALEAVLSAGDSESCG